MYRFTANSGFASLALLAVTCFSSAFHAYGADVIAHIKIEGAAKQRKVEPDGPSHVVLWLSPSPGTLQEARTVPPVTHYRLIQHNKQFSPHLLVIPVGSSVEFPNRDPFFHNVFSMFNGKRFDLGLYESGTSRMVRFDQPGVSYIFCNIHPEMAAVVIALPTPYFAISTSDGTVTMHDVPPGTYDLTVWAEGGDPEALKSLGRKVRVGTGAEDVGTIPIQVHEQELKHKNKFGEDYTPTADSPY
jgi:plastocyanin